MDNEWCEVSELASADSQVYSLQILDSLREFHDLNGERCLLVDQQESSATPFDKKNKTNKKVDMRNTNIIYK